MVRQEDLSSNEKKTTLRQPIICFRHDSLSDPSLPYSKSISTSKQKRKHNSNGKGITTDNGNSRMHRMDMPPTTVENEETGLFGLSTLPYLEIQGIQQRKDYYVQSHRNKTCYCDL